MNKILLIKRGQIGCKKIGIKCQYELIDINFGFTSLPTSIVKINFIHEGKNIEGIGIENRKKGFEFLEATNAIGMVTLIKNGITIVRHSKKEQSQSCCMFYNLQDYLSYYNLLQSKLIDVPEVCDIIILTDPSLLNWLMIEGDIYEYVYGYFPNDLAGCTISKSLADRYEQHYIDKRGLYKGYDTIYEYYKAVKNIL